MSSLTGLEPVRLRGRHDEGTLIENLKLIARPQPFGSEEDGLAAYKAITTYVSF